MSTTCFLNNHKLDGRDFLTGQNWPSTFKTVDISKAYQFYVEQLGLELVSTLPNALFMSTKHYHHHIAANTWQSSILRTENNATLGLTSIDIYKPNTDYTRLLSPEGFNITIHSDKSSVPG